MPCSTTTTTTTTATTTPTTTTTTTTNVPNDVEKKDDLKFYQKIANKFMKMLNSKGLIIGVYCNAATYMEESINKRKSLNCVMMSY